MMPTIVMRVFVLNERNDMTTTTTTLKDPTKIPVGHMWIYLSPRACKLHEMGLDENAIFTALKEFVVANCADPNYPDAKLKAIASAAVNPDPRFKDLHPIEFDFTPVTDSETDPEKVKTHIRRFLMKHKQLTKVQLQHGSRCDSAVFEKVWAEMLREGELESAGRTRHNTDKFRLADEMELTPHQQTVVEKIRALQEHTRLTGFKTTRSVNELKALLNAEDLAAVCRVLNSDQQ
jgi:hypothetical protein